MTNSILLRNYILINHTNLFFISLTSLLAIPTFHLTPSALPLIFNLSLLLLYSRPLFSKKYALRNTFLCWLGLTLGGSVLKLAASLAALSTPVLSVIILLAISGLHSALVLLAVFLDARLCMRFPCPWAQITFFPALWATFWSGVATLSPIGRLSAWSPAQGFDGYIWLQSFLGPAAIDWIVSAWAVVISQVIAAWLMNEDAEPNDDALILSSSPAYLHNSRQSTCSIQMRCMTLLSVILVLLVVPSYFWDHYPIPVLSQDTTPLTVGCVLPAYRYHKHYALTLQDYIEESKKLNGHATIMIWPEGAVEFKNSQEREDGFTQVRKMITGSYVGVSFEETVTDPGDKMGLTGIKRTGFALISKESDIPHITYYKRRLVPIAESFSLRPSGIPPDVFTLQLTHPKEVNKTEWAPGPDYTRPIPITTSICLDFTAQNAFGGLPIRPALILAPARTWDLTIGVAMWMQAKQRAEEIGSMVLWCDGGNGVSGIGGGGFRDVQQVGPGSWVKTIGVDYPPKESQTMYGATGNQGLWILWLIIPGLSMGRFTLARVLPRGKSVAKFIAGIGHLNVLREFIGRRWNRRTVVDERGDLLE